MNTHDEIKPCNKNNVQTCSPESAEIHRKISSRWRPNTGMKALWSGGCNVFSHYTSEILTSFIIMK